MPHSPEATALIWSVSPPLGERAMLSTMPLSHASVCLAQMLQHRAEQAQVVGVRAAADAQLALVLGIAQLLIGVDVFFFDAGFVIHNHAGAGGKAEPRRALELALPRRLAGMASSSTLDLTGCKQAISRSRHKRRRVHQQNHIGRRCGALGLEPVQNACSSASTRLILMPVVLVKPL